MTDYRQRYLDRGIPEFTPASCSPYTEGNEPREGWYIIEVSGESSMPDPVDPGTDDEPRKAIELLDEDAIRTLCDNYDPSVNGGKGPMANKDHLMLLSRTHETIAEGWIKALDYCVVEGQVRMAAYLSLNPSGHDLVRHGYYWAWSTEYLISDYYSRGEGKYSPRYLSGVALTNNPDHKDQPGISHAGVTSDTGTRYVVHRSLHITPNQPNQPTTMPNAPTPTRTVSHSAADPAEDPNKAANANSDPADPNKDTNVNSDPADPNKDTNCNNDDAGWLGIADQIASLLGLGSEASGDDIVAAVKSLKEDCDLLKSTETNSHSAKPAPRMLHAANHKAMAVKVTPQPDTVVHRTPDGKETKVAAADVSMVTHCRKAVEDRRTALGRALTQSEYNATWERAVRSFGS